MVACVEVKDAKKKYHENPEFSIIFISSMNKKRAFIVLKIQDNTCTCKL
jgi:hypothetical protein